jgi:sulfoxide reductase catalytic subunit YedY
MIAVSRDVQTEPIMLIKRPRPWALPESAATSETLFWNRREWLKAAGFAGAALSGAIVPLDHAQAQQANPSDSLFPAQRNPRFTLGDREVTPEEINTNYNNFYEFGSSKRVRVAAQALRTRPWTLKVDGLVAKPTDFAIDDLLKRVQMEERLYRHRCVEAWAMAVPWTGFSLSQLIAMVEPTSEARFVRFETFLDARTAPGQRQTWYPWPYIESITIAEAAHDLTFMVTGAYGKPLHNVFGAPIRVALPWKYGFKHSKSLTRISFVKDRPKSFWEALQPSEYGFWANVNPAVPHPRWSQASEQLIGTDTRVPTKLFNGYEAEVAHLYKDLQAERLWA